MCSKKFTIPNWSNPVVNTLRYTGTLACYNTQHLRPFLLLLLVMFAVVTPTLIAQPINTCRTTELGSTVRVWDWRESEYKLNYYPGNGPAIERMVSSPFHQGTILHPNTAFLAIANPDYEPTDGWELLYKRFGNEDDPVGEPSFGLYNRYSSLIRIFYWLEPNGETVYQNMTLNMRHQDDLSQPNVSAIFEHLNIPANALDNFDKAGLAIGQLNEVIINGTWMILEFPASYDACVCQYESSLEIRPILSSVTEMNFNITGTGTTTPIYGPGSSSGSYLGNGLDYFNNSLGALQSGYKIYKDLDGLIDDSDDAGALLNFAAGVLPSWLPIAGTAGKILGFLIGKGKSAGSPTLIGYNHDFLFDGTGTLETTGTYEINSLSTPGSRFAFQDDRSVYDNPLGLMQVLETPVVERGVLTEGYYEQTGEYDEMEIQTFRFTGSLRYAINEVAGLSNEPVRLMGALVWTDCEGNDIENGFYSSPLINIRCLEDYVVRLEQSVSVFFNNEGKLEKEEFGIRCGDPQLQIVAILESTDPDFEEEILFSARYKTDRENVPYDAQASLYEGLSADAIFAVCDPPPTAPISGSRLLDYCESVYDPSLNLNLAAGPITAALDEVSLPIVQKEALATIFPNPSSNYFTVSIPDNWRTQAADFELIDVHGRLMKNWSIEKVFPQANYTFQEGYNQLPAGQYYLRIVGEDAVTSYPIQKN